MCSLTASPSAWNKANAIRASLAPLRAPAETEPLGGGLIEFEVIGAHHADPEDEATALTWAVRSREGAHGPAAFRLLAEAFLAAVWGPLGQGLEPGEPARRVEQAAAAFGAGVRRCAQP